MAREFVKIDEWEDWVPPLPGERELYQVDPEDAVVMELRFLTKEQRDHYQRLADRNRKLGATSSADLQAMRQMFVDNVRNVRNYSVDGIDVRDGGQVFDVNGDTAMIVAITHALMERSSLDQGLAKKLRLGCDSSRSHPRPSDNGGALDVTLASHQTIQAAQAKKATYEFQMPTNGDSEVATAPMAAPSTTAPGPVHTTWDVVPAVK